MDRALAWLVMARADGVGRVRLASLMKVCPDPTDVWKLGVSDLLAVEHWNRTAANALVSVRKDREVWREAEAELLQATQAGLRCVVLPDSDYPYRLTEIPDPPPYFYQAGPWVPDDRPVVAIVGTRKATAYGLSVAHRFGRELAEMGAVVVSGMARGIDCAAHQGALEAGGTTIAVLACGADICYPREAMRFYRTIRQTGAVLSERAPGTPPRSEYFPDRNRIISGLAHGIVVVEAGERSGTLHTVRAATEQGRDVFAVPGPITSPMSVGPHKLVRDGACLTTSAREVLEELHIGLPGLPPTASKPAGLSPSEERLLGWMGSGPRWADELAEACGFTIGELQGTLTMLELKGLVRQLPDGQYRRIEM